MLTQNNPNSSALGLERIHSTTDPEGNPATTGEELAQIFNDNFEKIEGKFEAAVFLPDFLPSQIGDQFIYLPSLTGTGTSQKSSSILVNTEAITTLSGTLTELTIAAADTGDIKVHILSKSGSIFTSITSQIISITSGVHSYAVSMNALSGQYIGLEISATFASVKVYSSGQTGYWGGQSGSAFTNVPTALICYGFKVIQASHIRPEEVEAFKTEVISASSVVAEGLIESAVESLDFLLPEDFLPPEGQEFIYAGALDGTVTIPPSTAIWVNKDAKATIVGKLFKLSVNAGVAGRLIIYVLNETGTHAFTSVASQEIDILSGINTYDVNLDITNANYYIAVGVKSTGGYANLKYHQHGKVGFWGGTTATGEVFADGSDGQISYGFQISSGGIIHVRPQEIEDFKREILHDAEIFTNTALGAVNEVGGIQLYRYKTNAANSDIIQNGWTFGASGATSSIAGLNGIMYVNKQINIENKVHRAKAILYSSSNFALLTKAKEDTNFQTIVSVNVSNNSLNIYEIFVGTTLPTIRVTKTINFSLVNGREYIIEMYRLPRANGIRIIDPLTANSDYLEVSPTQTVHGTDKEVAAGGFQYDCFGVCLLSGTSPVVTELSTGYFGKIKPLLYIVGDSITYGYGTDKVDSIYAHLIGAMTGGDYVVSPRGGGKIGGVLEKIQTECAIIKPKYIMVTIGTNQASSVAQLKQLVNAIEAIGSIAIINCIPCRANGEQTTANNNILSMGVYGCRFDLATAIDPTATTLKADISLFVDGSAMVHPNLLGFARMANRTRIDLPFLI